MTFVRLFLCLVIGALFRGSFWNVVAQTAPDLMVKPGPARETGADPCNVGEYGSLCQNECHCLGAAMCDKTSGHCPDGCAHGYEPPTCSVCAEGYFGLNCTKTCRCLVGPSDCDITIGTCPGGCELGYDGLDCQNLIGFPAIVFVSNATQNVGVNFSLTCSATGLPTPSLNIISQNLTVVGRDWPESNISSIFGKVTQSFFFEAAKSGGLYHFTCVTNNSHGSNSHEFAVTFAEPPVILHPPTVEQKTATSVTLAWKEWSFSDDKGGLDNDFVQYLPVHRPTGQTDWQRISDWLANTSFVIENLMPDTGYDFAIRARRDGPGGAGRISTESIRMDVTSCSTPDEHSQPGNFSVISLGATFGRLAWSHPDHSTLKCSIKDFILTVAQNGSNMTIILNSSMSDYYLDRLNASTMYNLSLQATTEKGNGALTELSFITNMQGPGAVVNLTFVTKKDGIALKWKSPANMPEKAMKAYLVRADLLNIRSCSAIPPDLEMAYLEINTSKTEMLLMKEYLHYDSKYNVTVTGISDNGVGEIAEFEMSLPKAEPNSQPPMVNAVTEIKKMTFTWEKIPCHLANGELFYKYSLRKAPASKVNKAGKRRKRRSDNWITKDKETTENNVTVDNLDPFTAYEFSVRGATTAGDGPPFTATYWTKDALPTPPKMRSSSNSSSKILIMVQPSSGESGKTLKYQIKYSREDKVEEENSMEMDVLPPAAWIENLTPDTSYILQIRAESRSGWGEWSAIYKRKTKEGVPTAVTDLEYRQINSFAVVVSWLPPNITNGKLMKYTVECCRVTESTDESTEETEKWRNIKYEILNNENLTMVFEDLSPTLQYAVFVTASTASGSGEVANITINIFDPAVERSGSVEWYSGPPAPELMSFHHDDKSNLSVIYSIRIFPNIENGDPEPDLYQVLVINNDGGESLYSRDMNLTLFHNYRTAMIKGETCWIGGQIDASAFTTPLDIVTYQIGPLPSDRSYAFAVRPFKIPESYKRVAYYMSPPTEFVTAKVKPKPDSSIKVDYVLAPADFGSFKATIKWITPESIPKNEIIWYIVTVTLIQGDHICPARLVTDTEIKAKTPKVDISLFANANYTVLIAIDSLAVSRSIKFTISTNETVPLSSPRNLSAFDTFATSTNITWQAIKCDDANGDVVYVYTLCPAEPVDGADEVMEDCPAKNVKTSELFATFVNLYPNKNYIFSVAGVTSAGIGPWSPEFVFKTNEETGASSLPFSGCMILGFQCFWMVIIVVIILAVFWIVLILLICCKRRKRLRIQKNKCKESAKRMFEGDNTGGVVAINNIRNIEAETTLSGVFESDSMRQTQSFKKGNFFGPIPIRDLSEYISVRTTHPTVTFLDEFKQLSKEKHGSLNIAKKSENIKKNRYGNILPYDQTRVRLEPLPGFPETDYINASFIDGYGKPKVYIATQGPKENTFHDFWRMIIQEKVAVVVMLTSLVENKKKKCEQYWPSHFRLYGDILVTLTDTVNSADVVLRHFQLKIVGTNEVRYVSHYHYCDWPDTDIAPCISSVLDLRRRVRDELPSRAGPIVVHCSGGAGRTGTFIAIDAMLQQAYEEEFVHIFQYVNNIRTQRINLVQTPDQYKFIYDVVLEALQSGNTTVMCSRFPVYYRDICRSSIDEPSDLINQFNILANLERRKSCFPCPAALTEENANKNRNPEILPVEHSRVRLQSDNSDEIPSGSDPYINAVLCDGFGQKGQFLVTSMPLDETTEDFWHMIVKYRSSIIVMLNDSEFIDEQMVPGQYWPSDGCTQYGPYQAEIVTFEEKGMVNIRTMRVSDTRKPELDSHCVIQLQFLDWSPKEEVPGCASSFISMINMVNVLQRKYGGPITVHCANGAARSGIFCVSHVMKENVESGEVDVFQAVKRVRRHRPQLITSGAQYKFCYEVALELAIEHNEKH